MMRNFAIACLMLLLAVPMALSDSRMAELTELSKSTPVISMGSKDFERFAGGNSRPYSIMVFCNAAGIKEARSLKLPELLKKFKTLAKEVKEHAKSNPSHASSKIFFVELEMEQSRDVFVRLGVQNLPWIIHVSPEAKQVSGQWNIHTDETMNPTVYGRDLWQVSQMNHFMQARAHVDVGPIQEPSLLRNPFFIATALLALVPLLYCAWRIYTSRWIGSPWIWSTFVVSIFMFATSGGLHNIIRGVPLTRITENGVEWYQKQGQLGMEGFVVGGMYVFFALCCIGLLSVTELASSPATIRLSSFLLLTAAVLTFRQIVMFYTWKTGYQWRFYLLERLLS